MQKFKAERISKFDIKCVSHDNIEIYPLVRNDSGIENIFCVSPLHGRSFILKHLTNGRWIIGKGNGLSYTSYPYILSSSICGDTWGGLSLENALRDFNICNEVRKLGIKTNQMESVIALNKSIVKNGVPCQSALLQYSVECPYRISDFGFMQKRDIESYIDKWGSGEKYLYAADVLLNNLNILHSERIMHNAMNTQNYTWALELLDFEASRSNIYPYDNADYEACVPMLIEAEIIQVYEIINYIAWCLGETINYRKIEKLFDKYEFQLMPLNESI